ncbi:hypothetical protein BDZ45DRAFT_696273 [Acephala macrosclerotiorum]|nr:hypothetical protein BDZ45DRAFT_696273 [Acephala macrosclerotiorum]
MFVFIKDPFSSNAVAFSILFWSTAKASTCSNFTLFDATGSTTTPGPKINDTYPTSEWTLSNYVSESPNPDAPHVSTVRDTLKLQISHWGILDYTFLSAPGAASFLTSGPDCRVVDVNAANLTAIIKNGWMSFGTEEGNYTVYDTALRIPTPMIVTTWAKTGNSGWADTKVMCVPANQTITAGSRDVDDSGASASVTSSTSTSTVTSSPATTSKTSEGDSTFVAGFMSLCSSCLSMVSRCER